MKPCTIDVSDSDMGQRQHEGDHQMATTTRPPTKTITMPSASEEPIPEPVTQRKRADGGPISPAGGSANQSFVCDL
jgi:hypothetical protein